MKAKHILGLVAAVVTLLVFLLNPFVKGGYTVLEILKVDLADPGDFVDVATDQTLMMLIPLAGLALAAIGCLFRSSVISSIGAIAALGGLLYLVFDILSGVDFRFDFLRYYDVGLWGGLIGSAVTTVVCLSKSK